MNTLNIKVSSDVIVEIPPPKGGRKTLSIDNISADPVRYAFGFIPNEFSGDRIPAGVIVEWNEGGPVPQGILSVRGTVATLQDVNISDSAKEINHGKKNFDPIGIIRRWFN